MRYSERNSDSLYLQALVDSRADTNLIDLQVAKLILNQLSRVKLSQPLSTLALDGR